MNVITKNDKYYVTYGSDFQAKSEKKNRSSRKSKKQQTDRLEYAVFNDSDGAFTKNEEKINAINASKSDKKYISPTEIEVYNNTFYVNSQRNRYKVGPSILACLGAIICFPSAFFTFNSGVLNYSDGYIGKISPK